MIHARSHNTSHKVVNSHDLLKITSKVIFLLRTCPALSLNTHWYSPACDGLAPPLLSDTVLEVCSASVVIVSTTLSLCIHVIVMPAGMVTFSEHIKVTTASSGDTICT